MIEPTYPHACDMQAANAMLSQSQAGSAGDHAPAQAQQLPAPLNDLTAPAQPQAGQQKKRKKGRGQKMGGFFGGKVESNDLEHQVMMAPAWNRSMADIVRHGGGAVRASSHTSASSQRPCQHCGTHDFGRCSGGHHVRHSKGAELIAMPCRQLHARAHRTLHDGASAHVALRHLD